MTVTLTYDATLSRVRVDATSLGTAATALVERSTDQVRWSTVRGGTAVTVTAGTMSTVDDYEFSADVENFYRVQYFATPSFVSAGTTDTDNNAAVTPGLPAGHAAGDLLLLFAAIRNLGVGTVDTPAGWTELVSMSGNAKLFGKVSVGGAEVGPTVTFTGGVAGADTAAQICALRNVDMTTLVSASAAAAAQDIVTPIFDLGETWYGAEVLYLGWKADDWTSVALAQGTEIAEFVSTAGSDMGMVWNHRHIAETVSFTELGTQTFTVTGGGVATGQGGVVAMEPTTLSQDESITPTLGGEVWLKFLARPFLNTPVDAYGEVNVTRRARNAVYPVVGRTVPVAVTDVRAGRELSLSVKTLTAEAHSRLDYAILGGDPVFVHTPPDSPLPTMYAVIGDTSDDQPIPGAHLWTLPLTEVAAPAAEIVGATITYQGVVNAYATYQAVLDDKATYADLLTLIGDPADIITD